MIKCKKCLIEKEDTEFYWRVKGVRRTTQCKKCRRAVIKKYAGTEAGKAVAKKKKKKYAGSAKGKAADKKHNGTEKRKATQKKYWESAKGKVNTARAAAKRRSKIEGTINDLTPEQWVQIKKEQDYKCNGCKIRFDTKPATVDHIHPLVKGGGLTKDNIQALCKSCNSIKGNRTMEYLTERIKEKAQDMQ